LRKMISIWIIIMVLISATLSGCSDQPPAIAQDKGGKSSSEKLADEPKQIPETNQQTSKPVSFKQAPELEGKNLPPLEQRLPKEPKILNQIPSKNLKGGKLEIGRYGGTLRMANPGPEWNPDIFLMVNEPLLSTPGSTGEEVTSNVLKDFKMSDDRKEFTFTLREGMKWSDGAPVTTEDVKFTVEDVIFNKDLTPIFPDWLRAGGKKEGNPLKFQTIDEYTFKMSFDQPYGRFPIQLALTGWRGYSDLLKPKHYLTKYHVKYTPLEQLEPSIKEAGFQKGEWVNLFNDKDITNWELTTKKAIGFPVLYPWMMVKSTETQKKYARNPYFWKIDAAGNQMPYIDGIESTLVQDVEMMSTKVISGEVDLMRESAALNKMPLYKEYAEKKGYIATMLDMHVDPTSIFLNLTNSDENWRKVVKDVRFRKAVNMAIDRKEIIDAVYYGFGELPKLVPNEFNPDKANSLLDEMGMNKRDKDGYRIGPDRKTFEIPIETGAHAPDMVPVLQLVVDMWKNVGIKATLKTIDPQLWGNRNDGNELKATIFWNVQPMWRSGGWTDFIPNFEGPLWNQWFRGKAGEAPTDSEVKRLFELSGEIMSVYPGTPGDKKLMDEIYKLQYDNIFQMPIAEHVRQPIILSAKLGNVPTGGTAVAANIAGVQMFYRQ
jgi:peptide/nickel transport system substrate-binding protein